MNAPPELAFEDERLTAFLDGELSPAEQAALQADLDRDPTLRAELEALTSVSAFLGDHVPLAAPPDFLDEVLANVAEENVVQLAWYRRPFGVPLEGLAVAAAALLVIYVALPEGSSPTTEPTEVASGRAAPMKASPPKVAKDVPTPVQAPMRKGSTKSTPKADGGSNDDGVAVVDPGESGKDWQDAARKAEQQALAAKAKAEERAKGVADFDLPNKAADTRKEGAPPDLADQNAAEKSVDLKGAKPLFSQVPYSYAITTQDPAVLAQLAALAAQYSGELKGKGDKALSIEELSGNDAATVTVKIPSHALQDFGRSLAALGVVQTVSDNSMFAGDPVEVRVSVKLVQQPGIAAPPKKAPAATSTDLK